MKVIILGDCHFGARQSSEIIASHQKIFFKQLIEYGNEHNIKTIIQLGDIFDQRKNINIKTVKHAYDIFNELAKNGFELHTLIGNHDVFFRDTLEITSTELLLGEDSYYKNVHVYKEPTTIEFGNCKIDMIPWLCQSNENDCFNYIKNSKSQICCGHFEIDTFPVLYKIEHHGGLKSSLFLNYNHVFSGHFHLPSEKGNITYVGTPYQLTWSDLGSTNGFWIFDTESYEYFQIPNPDKYFRVLYYNDQVKGVTTRTLDETLKDSYVKIIVENRSNLLLFNWYLNKVYSFSPADVKIVENQFTYETDSTEANEEVLKLSTIDIIKQYIDKLDSVNKEKLQMLMIELYNRAITDTMEG